MTLPSVYPTGFDGTVKDFLKVTCDRSGAARLVTGTVSVPSATAADAYVGVVPFRKGAKFFLGDKSIYCGNFGAGTTTVNVGIIYSDNTNNTNDVDAWASLSTAPQSGGWVTVDEIEGMSLVTTADGWLAVQLKTADADATANIVYAVTVAYD